MPYIPLHNAPIEIVFFFIGIGILALSLKIYFFIKRRKAKK